MNVRSPDMLLREEQHKLNSHKLDNYMFALGLCCMTCMLVTTLALLYL